MTCMPYSEAPLSKDKVIVVNYPLDDKQVLVSMVAHVDALLRKKTSQRQQKLDCFNYMHYIICMYANST